MGWNIYDDGYLEIFLCLEIWHEALLVMVYEIVCGDVTSCFYELRTLFNSNGKMTRFKIKNNKDV